MGMDSWPFISQEGEQTFKEPERGQDPTITWTSTDIDDILRRPHYLLKLGFRYQVTKAYTTQSIHCDL
jgi:hypothetical protein